MTSVIHLCSFSSSISELTKKQAKDPITVLQVLINDPMVSTWEMDDSRNLYKTIDRLRADGLIKDGEAGYPWHKFIVTEKGLNAVLASAESETK